MRIAINGLFWDKPFTGSGMYLRQIWRYLPDVPGQHKYIMLRPEGEHEQVAPRPNAIALDRPVAPFAPKSERAQKVLWEQWGLLSASHGLRADVLHSPYLAAPRFANSRRLIVTVHDLIPWVLPDYRSSGPMRLYLALAGSSATSARLLLTDSEASRRDIIKHLKTKPGKVKVIMLGAEPELFRRPSVAELAEMRQRLNLPERFAFYIGGFDQRKNIPLLLCAWATALPKLREQGEPDPVLVIAGNIPAPGGIVPDIMAEARALGLLAESGGPLRLLGRVSEEDKHRLLAAARLFLFPSLYEGFGYDPLEALATGAPVICSNSSSLPEVMGDAGILIAPDDEQAWTAAITNLWFDDNRRAQLAANGPQQAAKFKPEETARQTLQAYTLVAHKP